MKRMGGLLAAVFISIVALATLTLAAEVRVTSSTGLNAVIAELVSLFETTSGHKVSLGTPALAADVAKRIEAGEAMDVAVLNPSFAKTLIAAGKIADGSSVDFVRLGIGVAVRAGDPRPDISTADALKQAVLNAKSVTYTRGGSGVHFEALLGGWGILDQIKSKAKQVSGGEAIPAVARGEIELGIDVMPQIVSVAGVDLVGPLPPDLQNYVVLTAVILSTAREPAAARSFVDFLKGPAAASAMKARGMEPIP